MDFSGIFNSAAPKNLVNFIVRLLKEIGIGRDKLCIVACHRLGKIDITIAKFLNRKDAENVYSDKKKSKDVHISCLLTDDDI